MINTVERRRVNPFATRWVRPGAIPFQFPTEINSHDLIERLDKLNWRGAIVGPHGSGKSALLAELIPQIERAGRSVVAISLHSNERSERRNSLAALAKLRARIGSSVVLIIDGWEQLSWWRRMCILRFAQHRQCGLLVTAHNPSTVGRLPLLFRTSTNLDGMQHMVRHCLPWHGETISEEDIAAAFLSNRGNIRDALFSLYDLFEQRIADRTMAIRL